jgi:hypothetical protein
MPIWVALLQQKQQGRQLGHPCKLLTGKAAHQGPCCHHQQQQQAQARDLQQRVHLGRVPLLLVSRKQDGRCVVGG